MDKPADVDQYLETVSPQQAVALRALRELIRRSVPEAVESISYGMPTFKYRGKPLIYFGAWKNHCAIYGASARTVRFAPETPPSDDYIRSLLEEQKAAITAKAAPKPRPSKPSRQP